ncbi:hypothetical protein ACJMK2_014490 [Sinanodonta woodiana]|uniref:Outer dynein arm-docking complex subunit 4 n=1 Tax=Sinanodonta woodiana TaxID=1069815 RepID=A0ABD3V0W5_SINWO
MPRGRGGSDNGSENQDQVGTFETLRDEGEHFVHVKQYQKAIESFTRALEMKADDKNCLVTRSKCWLQLGNAENALTDAQVALDQDKEFIRGLFQKAEALYQMGDFETALVFYHRGHRLRPELQEFRLGIQKCQEAINNSIGSPSSVKLEAKGDLSFFYKQEEAKKQGQKGYQKPGQKKEVKKEREKPGRGAGDSKTIKQLLGELYGDKEYLEKLNKDESLMGNRNDMSRDIKDRVCDGLDYLYSRADFWRQQKPMYARKRDKDRIQRSNPPRDSLSPDKILRALEEIDEAQSAGHYEESLQKARQTLKAVENYPDEELQNKQELLANIYSCMGNAYLEMGKFNQAMEFHERDWKIAKENNLEDAKSRALDNRGRVHARKGEYQEAINVWEEKLPMSKSPLESTWLYHEIGRCYLELANYNKARDYGEKSLAAARESDDQSWQLHANVLIAQSEVKLGDYQAAADSFEKSLEMAKKQEDKDAENAIKRALEEVNARIVKGVKDDDDEEPRKVESVDGDNTSDNRKEEHKRENSPHARKHKADDTTSDNVKVTDDSPRADSPGRKKHEDVMISPRY